MAALRPMELLRAFDHLLPNGEAVAVSLRILTSSLPQTRCSRRARQGCKGPAASRPSPTRRVRVTVCAYRPAHGAGTPAGSAGQAGTLHALTSAQRATMWAGSSCTRSRVDSCAGCGTPRCLAPADGAAIAEPQEDRSPAPAWSSSPPRSAHSAAPPGAQLRVNTKVRAYSAKLISSSWARRRCSRRRCSRSLNNSVDIGHHSRCTALAARRRAWPVHNEDGRTWLPESLHPKMRRRASAPMIDA